MPETRSPLVAMASYLLKSAVAQISPDVAPPLVAAIVTRFLPKVVEVFELWAKNPDQLEFEWGQLRAEIKGYIAALEGKP